MGANPSHEEETPKKNVGSQIQRSISDEPKTFLKLRPTLRKRRGKSMDPTTPPIVDPQEVERRFEETLKKMDLPVNKAKALRNYDLQKKWKVVCDQEKVTDQGAPGFYLDKLRAFMYPMKGTRTKRRNFGDETSTRVLKHLEISLRTNTIDWVREFLNEQNDGLAVLVNYMKLLQAAGGLQTPPHLENSHGNSTLHRFSHDFGSMARRTVSRKTSTLKTYNKSNLEDDIHVCIQCMRALMNNTYGFNMVFNDNEAIDCIVRSILHPSLRTKTSVLMLLSGICYIKGGHELVLGCFERFKKEFHEDFRFQTFFNYFRHYDEFHVDFMVCCMQFINILVHNIEDTNYRLFLQHEFKLLGLEDYLDKLKNNESDDLQDQIAAYMDNMVDVNQLLDDAANTDGLHQRMEDLQMELSRANERLQESEANYMAKVGQLDYRLTELLRERDSLLTLHRTTDKDLDTLRKALTMKDQEARHENNRLESRIHELEELQKSFKAGIPMKNQISNPPTPDSPVPKSTVPPPPPAPIASNVPPPPAPPLLGKNAPNAPPPPPNFGMDSGVMTIKNRIQTKYKLPQLNWTALKPNQLKGTVFGELDDEKILKTFNFDDFEETFKMGVSVIPSDITDKSLMKNPNGTPVTHKKETTLLDHKRIRNIAITKRKLAMEPLAVMRAVNQFDLKALNVENVEILLHVLPNADEIKLFKDYESTHKSVDELSTEDQFMIQMAKIERLSQKLQIMNLMGNFDESINLLLPSLNTLSAASTSVKGAKKFPKVLELILAFGNYMNSSKRGAVYGFKLQSLDSLSLLKAPTLKNFTMIHYLAQIVRSDFPELLNFNEELKFVEKSSTISLESVLADCSELEKGMDMVRKECSFRGPETPLVLTEFVKRAEIRFDELKKSSKLAQESFRDCCEFYGESPKTSTNSFFTILLNFSKHFQQADEENIARKKAESAQEKRQSKSAGGDMKHKQAALLEELSQKGIGSGKDYADGGRRRSRKWDPTEMGLGTLDNIISDITREPYRDVSRQRSIREKQKPNLEVTRKRSRPAETEI